MHSPPARARRTISLLASDLDRRRAPRFEGLELQLVGNVVLVDVAYVDDGLLTDAACGNELDVVEPDVAIQALRRRFGTQAGDAAGAGVVRSDGEECAVLLVDPRGIEVLVVDLPQVLEAAVHVGLGLGDVADLEPAGRLGHELHDADRADMAARVLVEPRLLVAERRHHQVVEAVALAIFAEKRDRLLEALPIGLGGVALRPLWGPRV